MIQCNHKVREALNQERLKSKGVEKMKSGTLIVTEVRTNKMYMSETTLREIRQKRKSSSGVLFADMITAYPTAEIVCLTDEAFNEMFGELEAEAEKNYGVRNVLSISNLK